MLTSKKNFYLQAFPLFIAVFIDGAGFGLFFPLLNALVVDPRHSLLPADFAVYWRDLFYGLVVSIYMFTFFIGAAVFGDLSDYLGRRKVLCFCLFGTFLGYLFSVIAVLCHSFLLLLLGRIIDGSTAGSMPLVQAAIVDISTADEKARHIGLVLFFSSCGFILGPLAGGLLSDSRLVSWFSFATPFYFVAGLALFSFILMLFLLTETLRQKRQSSLRLTRAFQLFAEAFKTKSIRDLSILLLCNILAWGFYIAYLGFFVWHYYRYSATQVGLLWTVLAVGYAIGFIYLVNKLQRFSTFRVLLFGFMIVGCLTLLSALLHYAILIWLFAFVIGMVNGVVYTFIITAFSNRVDETKQGWVMGLTGSVMALAMTISTLIGGFIVDLSAMAPFIATGVIFLVAGVFTCCYHPE
ncbi:MAG: MFS transporter [Pseudomonadota bacterium]